MYSIRPIDRRTKRILTIKNRTNKSLTFLSRSAPVLVITILIVSLVAGNVLPFQARNVNSTAPLVLGELPYQKLTSHALTNRANMLVNVTNGNAILQTQDLNVNSVGPGISVTRYFNDLGTGSGQVGSHDTLSVGGDVHITANANGSVTYQGPSGFQVTFPSNGSGGYTTPTSYTAAKLTSVSGGGWKLTFNANNEVYTFDASGNQTKDTSANGQAVTYAYNSNGTLATATDAQGKVVYFSNYNGTDIGKISDSTGRYTTYTYTNGQLTSMEDAAGGIWQFQYYDQRGNLNQISDPRGYTTTLAYNSSNQVSSINYNDFTSSKATYSYTYNAGNTIVTDPLSHQTTYDYDTQGRVTHVVDAVGADHGAAWDTNNNMTSVTSPSSEVTKLTYDQINNLTSVQNPSLASGKLGAKTSQTYGNSAHPYLPASKIDAQGNQVAYSYDITGNLMSSTNSSAGGTGMGSTTQAIQGDPNGSGGTTNCGALNGEVCSSTDANGNTTTYGYDAQGNVTSVNPPGPVGNETIGYDSLSRPNSLTDGNGSTVTVSYNNLDQPTDLSYAADGSHISYTYDADGNLVSRSDGAGQTGWVYDGANHITQIQQSGQSNLNYTYDLAGNLKTEQGSAGTTTYAYDNANQIASITKPDSSVESFTFSNSQLTHISLPGSITETISYDVAGRETSIKAVRGTTTLTSYTGSYTNSAGNDTGLLQSEKNLLTNVTTNFSYDGLNRVTKSTATGTGANSYTYTYDKNGNRTQYSHNGSYSAIYGYNAANELTTAGGASDGSYDQAGNQTSTGAGLGMSYNAKNQTSTFTPSGGNTESASYTDASQTNRTTLGNLAQQNGLLGLYSDTTTGSGGTTAYYSHLPTGSNQTLSEIVGSSSYYYLTDLLGSTVSLTDTTGTVKNTYSYDPYGNTLTSTGTISNPIQFAGGYKDQSTGLYKFGTRYYNPSDGRWSQLDPSGQNPGYLYAGDDPVNFVDPGGTALTNSFLLHAVNSYMPPQNTPSSFSCERQAHDANLVYGYVVDSYVDSPLIEGLADVLGSTVIDGLGSLC